jgi:ribose 5-phosphate isomerase A
MAQENLKELVGRKAASLVEDGMTIGLGTGSTVFYTIQELGKLGKKIKAVPSSVDTEKKAKEAGIELITFSELDNVEKIDLAIDGADEVDKDLNLIKGGGGALTREKKIAYQAERFIVVVDESKMVDILGKFPLPVEVLKTKTEDVKKGLEKIGARVSLRGSENPFVTDNGNYILDAKFEYILKPDRLEQLINKIDGVVENGIFRKDKVTEVWVGSGEEVKVLK